MKSFNFQTLPPLALYVHIPWCIKKCPYCDFNSHQFKDELPQQEYLLALQQDLEEELPHIWGRRLSSIFIGGGTLSLFSAESIDQLLTTLKSYFNFNPDLEITLEANPGTFEINKFSEFNDAGINRLSVGIQSFNPDHLQALGRIHDDQEAIKACEQIRAAGFDNFNLDLMFGLPGQDTAAALLDINTALSFKPTHLSHYQLTIEPQTAFFNHPPALPNDDKSLHMLDACQDVLSNHGYANYEVSAYSQAGYQCKHNLNYWSFGDYLGIGAGAHSKISDAATQSIKRSSKIKNPRQYMAATSQQQRLAEQRSLTLQEIGGEFMMNALRLKEGFDSATFERHTGLPLQHIEAPLQQAEQAGFICRDGDNIKATPYGFRFLDEALLLFI